MSKVQPIRPPTEPDPRDAVWVDLQSLAVAWRADAAVLHRRGCSDRAEILEDCARELERRVTERSVEAELLTLEEAARETAMSYHGLWKAVNGGRLRNFGGPGRPRVRRGDLFQFRKGSKLRSTARPA